MGKKVLVVDDEKLIVKGIRFSLEQDGYEVDCAYDGEEALESIKNKEYDMTDTAVPLVLGSNGKYYYNINSCCNFRFVDCIYSES